MIRDPETFNSFLDAITRFVKEELVPAEFEVAEVDRIPDRIANSMKEMGLFGLSLIHI